MNEQSPYQVIKNMHVTEKSRVLQELKNATSNPCVSRCEAPKYVFLVDVRANKKEIAQAVEEIYSEKNIKVAKVNTINVKGKRRRVRGRAGKARDFKKAIVTLETNDSLDDV
ncbi:MAG: 50S ribosomal protein L23 [Chlamydiales bacterium]|nr:50S ribosomal protein L23 [Chlamydiia bacterium]MCP5506901.1 50S ribosomal protein L23 [Chlamydiales bacterium]